MAEVTLKGETTKIQGSFLVANNLLPDFLLVNGDLENITLEYFRGKKKVLLFVPSLDTGVCQKEAKKLQDYASTHAEYIFLLISCDLPFAQKRFCQSENIANIIPLSVMRTKSILEQYGVLINDGPLAGLATRAVVVANENDYVIYSELVPEITDEPDYDKLFEALESSSS